MPTIRISDQNYQRLQQFAVPLQDTPNDALGRVLDLAELAKQHGLSAESTKCAHKQTIYDCRRKPTRCQTCTETSRESRRS